MSPRVWIPVPGILLFLGAVGCMDYGLNAPRRGSQPTLQDTAVPVEPPPEDSASPLREGSLDLPEQEDPEDDPIDPEPEAGCADGQREGYQDWDAHPDIAACSGGWSVGGLTRADLAPTCGHGAGDDSPNSEGSGCSPADLCSAGWHVCQGKTEVAEKAGSCADAVPWGTPDKSLLFAVAQHSDNGSVCDDAAGSGNDVFGCGNLGTELTADKDCGVLNRVLASMHQDACGFNEAEPNLGPWECMGGSESHYHEGELVTKKGCPGGSCSYDGYAVGNSDKGGVLCCRD